MKEHSHNIFQNILTTKEETFPKKRHSQNKKETFSYKKPSEKKRSILIQKKHSQKKGNLLRKNILRTRSSQYQNAYNVIQKTHSHTKKGYPLEKETFSPKGRVLKQKKHSHNKKGNILRKETFSEKKEAFS